MTVAFVRQLGYQPGIQLNPVVDASDGFAPETTDQVFAVALRASRGRIDKPFLVDRGNVLTKLGRGGTIRASALNEALIQTFEALYKGADRAVVQRLTVAGAPVLQEVVMTVSGAGVSSWAVASAFVPGALLSVKHMECFNDGIIVEVHADPKTVAGVPVANDMVTVRLRDPFDSKVLYEFFGSLDPAAIDDYGQSVYLPDVVSKTTEDVVITVGTTTSVPTTYDFYGTSASTGFANWAVSGTQLYFTEGGTAYATTDYVSARTALQNTPFDYAYIISGGNQSSAFLAQMVQLAYDTNRQFVFDVPGALTPAAGITFVQNLNFDSQYVQCYWAPLLSDDPLNGPQAVLGTAGFNVARRCARNAQRNSRGFAPKNFPVAGKAHPLTRTGIKQTYIPTTQELSDLAYAHINPVLFERYNGGGAFVFTDSVTLTNTLTSFRKLIAVAEMSSTVDEWVTRYGKELLQLPMKVAITKMKAYLDFLFKGAEGSGWIVPSEALGGKSFAFSVKPNAISPADKMDVEYALRYDGTLRQIVVTQTISR